MRLATSLGLFTSLVAAVPGVDVGADVGALLTIDLNVFPDSVLSAQCNECCPTTIRTIITQIYTTVYSEKTIYTTATQHDVSTKVQYTTKYVTTTALSTYTRSYPVTVTTTIDCDHPHKRYDESVGNENTAQVPKLKGRTYGCRTTTVTSWATTTATKTVTGIESIVTTQTVPHETTIHDTRTIVDSTTIWVPTTYTETKTVVSEHPVTMTVDNTKYTTKSTTIVTTFVSTVTTSFPVVTTLTLPGQTYTAPGETVTAPGYNVTETLQGPTVTAPGQTSTITLPGVTKTLPGSTVVTTQTRTLPPSTIHVTDEQQTKTITRSGYTVIETSTITLPPTTIDKPATTITVTPMFEVTLCPTPTGASAPLFPSSNRTFGCEPGYVCNPPKPYGCNLWPEPPSDTFLCDPNDCIPSPPLTNVTWPECETSYYPPSYGYFNLNPEAFGLSYDIFEYKVVNETINGHLSLITTGNWGSQTSLTAWPKPSPTTKSEPASYGRMGKRTNDHRACRKSKRDITPSVCYGPCDRAYIIAQSVGKSDKLCETGSEFLAAVNSCKNCIDANSNSNSTSTGSYTDDKYAQYLNFCSGKKAEPPTASPTTPEQLVSHQPTLGTSTQVDVSLPTFTPVSSSWSLTQSSPSTPSLTNTAGSTSVSDTPSSHSTRLPPSSRQSSIISTLPGSVSGGSTVQNSGISHSEGTSSPTATQTTATQTTATQTTATHSTVTHSTVTQSTQTTATQTTATHSTVTQSAQTTAAQTTATHSTVTQSTATHSTVTHSTALGTAGGSSSPGSTGNAIGSSLGSGSGSGSVPNSKNGNNASGTSPSPSESTSNVNVKGGSSQLGNTTDGAPGNPPTSTPPTVTAAASRLSSLVYSVGAILVSSAVIIMC